MEKEWIRAISLFNLFTLSSIVRRGYGLPPRITIFLIYPSDRYPSGVLRELVFSNHLQDNSNHFIRKSIIGYNKLYIYMSGIITQEALLVLLALASYRTKSRVRHVLPLLHETYSPRNIGSKREKKKKSYAHLTYFPIYIYTYKSPPSTNQFDENCFSLSLFQTEEARGAAGTEE